MDNKPWYQRVILFIRQIIIWVGGIGAFLVTLSDLSQIVTREITIYGLIILAITYAVLLWVVRMTKPAWLFGKNSPLRIRDISRLVTPPFLAAALVLVLPRIRDVILPSEPPINPTPTSSVTIQTPSPIVLVKAGKCGGVLVELTVPADAPDFNREYGFSVYHKANIGLNSESPVFGNTITALYADEEGIWVGYIDSESGDYGLLFISTPVLKGSIEPARRVWEKCLDTEGNSIGPIISEIAKDAEGNLWVATDGSGVWRLSNGNWEHFLRDQISDDEGLPERATYAVVPHENVVYVATLKGLVQWNGFEWIKRSRETDEEQVLAIAFGPDDETWIGFAHLGLRKILSNGSFVDYNTRNGLESNEVRGIVVDPIEERIWAATWGGGVSVLEDGNWTTYRAGEANFPHDNVHVIAIDPNGRVWVGTENGSSYFDGEQWAAYSNLNTLFMAFGSEEKEGCPDTYDVWTGTQGNGLLHSSTPALTDMIDNIQVSGVPEVVAPNEVFTPTVTFELEEESQISESDFLHIQVLDEPRVTNWPFVKFIDLDIQEGNIYTVDFSANPFTAPSQTGLYSIPWRLWQCTRYIGPPIVIEFAVQNP